jgi:hypothetical protein
MYIPGVNQNNQVEPSKKMTWLDYLIISNPQGVMHVLDHYGYTGYLAPQDEEEMYEVCLDLMDKHGDPIVVDLLKSHPLYDVISDICKEETKITIPFKNASGEDSQIVTTIRTINFKKLAEDALIIIGAFYLAGIFWKFMTVKGE